MLALFHSGLAHAFTLSSTSSKMAGWEASVLKVNGNFSQCPSEVDMPSIVSAAMATWNTVPEITIKLAMGGTSTANVATTIAGNAVDSPLILCSQNFSADTQADGNTVPGLTGIAISNSSKRIVYSYTLLNTQSDALDSITRLDPKLLTVIVAHEFGHVLGLGHSADPSALMYYDVTGKTDATLSPDDIKGVQFLYGKDRPKEADSEMGCGSIKPKGGSGTSGLGPFAQLGGICLAGLLFLRRKSGFNYK